MDDASTIKSVGERGIAIRGPVVDRTATLCIAQLLYLVQTDSEKAIRLEIDSPGGQVTPSIAIIRMLDALPCPIHTFCSGQAGGTAISILAHGRRGFRTATSTATFGFAPLHPGSSYNGIEAGLSQLDQVLVEMLAADCDKHEHEIRLLNDARSELCASQALELGLIDAITDPKPPIRLTKRWSERLQRVARAAFAALAPRFRHRAPWGR